MNLADTYRANAEDCLRLAASETAESDLPLWATLARSWLQLAEDFGRIGEDAATEPAEPTPPPAAEKPKKRKKN